MQSIIYHCGLDDNTCMIKLMKKDLKFNFRKIHLEERRAVLSSTKSEIKKLIL